MEHKDEDKCKACDYDNADQPAWNHSGCEIEPKCHEFLFVNAKDNETLIEFHDILGGDSCDVLEEKGVFADEIVFETDGSFRQLHVLNVLASCDIVWICESWPDVLAGWGVELSIIADVVDLAGESTVDDISVIGAKVLEVDAFIQFRQFVVLVCYDEWGWTFC